MPLSQPPWLFRPSLCSIFSTKSQRGERGGRGGAHTFGQATPPRAPWAGTAPHAGPVRPRAPCPAPRPLTLGEPLRSPQRRDQPAVSPHLQRAARAGATPLQSDGSLLTDEGPGSHFRLRWRDLRSSPRPHTVENAQQVDGIKQCRSGVRESPKEIVPVCRRESGGLGGADEWL